MPLSEEELRLLEQMERAIVEEDPKFASTLRGITMRRAQRRHVIIAGLGLAGGVAVLMTAVITGLWAVGIAGFVLMVASACLGIEAIRGRTRPLTLSAARPSRLGSGRRHHDL